MKLRIFEAFAGVGSQRMALRNLGIDHEVVAIAEIDKHALQSYEAIHGDCPNLGDISKLHIDEIPDHDLFTYSFPCQDISEVNGRKKGLAEGSGTRSSLLWQCKRVIQGKKPRYLLLENVKSLVSPSNKPHFDKWIEWLVSQGYTNYTKILNSKNYGVAQNRERTFVVSVLGEHSPYTFPEEIKLDKCLGDYLEEDFDPKYVVPQHCLQGYQGKASIFRNRFTVKDLNEIAYCLVAKGGRAVITNNYIYADISMYDNKPCENNDLDYLADNQILIRALTSKEYWRLMGFTDEDYQKAKDSGVSDAQLYKQAGNSIVVNVLEGIFKQLFLKESGVK